MHTLIGLLLTSTDLNINERLTATNELLFSNGLKVWLRSSHLIGCDKIVKK